MADSLQPLSQSLKQPKQIPEMGLGEFQKLMKSHFDVGCERTDREYLVRFVSKPYKEEVENCRSMSVMTHGRGAKVSPHNIKQILAKFEISEERFHEAYKLTANKVEPIRPNKVQESKV